MMKKIQKVTCAIFVFCCICFTACNHKPAEMASTTTSFPATITVPNTTVPTTTATTNTTAPTTTDTTTPATTAVQPTIWEKYDRKTSVDYKSITKTVKGENAVLEYPDFQGVKNKKTQQGLNDIIKKHFTGDIESILANEYNDYEMHYEITLCTSDIVSIVFYGHVLYKESNIGSSVIDSLVIDLNTLAERKLSDFVIVDVKLANELLQSTNAWNVASRTVSSSEEDRKNREETALRQFREAYDAAEIIDACKEFDGITPGLFYVTSDSVWIGFRMSHAEGDSIMVRLAR